VRFSFRVSCSGVTVTRHNDVRTHQSLDKDAPVSRPVQRAGSITSFLILGGLNISGAMADK
jgi:hypothetical protein